MGFIFVKMTKSRKPRKLPPRENFHVYNTHFPWKFNPLSNGDCSHPHKSNVLFELMQCLCLYKSLFCFWTLSLKQIQYWWLHEGNYNKNPWDLPIHQSSKLVFPFCILKVWQQFLISPSQCFREIGWHTYRYQHSFVCKTVWNMQTTPRYTNRCKYTVKISYKYHTIQSQRKERDIVFRL